MTRFSGQAPRAILGIDPVEPSTGGRLRNHGRLFAELTPEKLLERHSSYPRNKNLAEVFYRAGFIESWGRGIRKIVDGMTQAELPRPKIEDADG